jgi:hypothetical protein
MIFFYFYSTKNSKLKIYLLPTNHVINTKKFQSKIICILSGAKKINLTKFWNRLIGAVRWKMWGRWAVQLRRDWLSQPPNPSPLKKQKAPSWCLLNSGVAAWWLHSLSVLLGSAGWSAREAVKAQWDRHSTRMICCMVDRLVPQGSGGWRRKGTFHGDDHILLPPTINMWIFKKKY